MIYKMLVSAALVTTFFSGPAQARYWMCVGSERAWDTLLISEVLDDTKNPNFKEDWAVAAQKYWHSLGRDQVVQIGRVCDGYATYDEAQAGVEKILKGIGWKSRTLVPLVPVRDAKKDNSGDQLVPDYTGRAKAPAITSEPAASPKYVEVPGPNGVIRLSPEVAARNKAAEEDYERKLKAHAETVAKAQVDQERSAALHKQSIERASAVKREYEQQLALNDVKVAARRSALEQPKAETEPPAKGAKGWMYCDARGGPGDKRRYYSRVTEVDYVPGEITIIDVMAKNRPAFKSYVAGAHSIYFATESLLHCPYSTSSLTDAEALMARDKRGDGNNGIEIIQTGWVPTN